MNENMSIGHLDAYFSISIQQLYECMGMGISRVVHKTWMLMVYHVDFKTSKYVLSSITIQYTAKLNKIF